MSHIPLPMNAAHQHAANAEDFLTSGLYIPAAEEYSKAAEAYLAAAERSSDESTKRTLHLLHNDHTRAAKELERKIQRLREEGRDPSLPQKLEAEQPQPPRTHHRDPETMRSQSTPPHKQMTDSQNAVDESFMLLAGQRSDPGDAFNQFWNIMQGMLDNLSQPVAFATVPMGSVDTHSNTKTPPPPRRESSLSSDTDSAEEPMFARFTKRIGMSKVTRKEIPQSNLSITTSNSDDDFDDGLFDEETLGNELSESFFVVPSGNELSSAALRRENLTLKQQFEAMSKRLESAERLLQHRKEQDLHLRDSIFQATREAQRAMGASAVIQRSPGLDFSNLASNFPAGPIPGITSGREAQYTRRLKELEDELRNVRAENEKHKAMIVKFRERWEKLKESAKRKKEAKAAASLGAREKILEEPEAEEELDIKV